MPLVPVTAMRVDIRCLMAQAWRSAKLYGDFYAYARSIGCEVVQDEIVCVTDEHARKLAAWWTERAT